MNHKQREQLYMHNKKNSKFQLNIRNRKALYPSEVITCACFLNRALETFPETYSKLFTLLNRDLQ